MERHLDASTDVRAPLPRIRELLQDDPGCLISDVVSPDDRSARRFLTFLGTRSKGGTALHQEVLVDVGRVEDRDDGVCMPVSWHPVAHQRLLPTFEGELLAAETDGGRTRLMLGGLYRVPVGVLGRFGDSIFGRRVARQSVSGLLQEIAGRLDREVDRRNKVPVRGKPAPYPVDLRESPHSDYHIG